MVTDDLGIDVPLMQEGSPSSPDRRLENASIRRPTLFIWALTVAAGISGLLFGYE